MFSFVQFSFKAKSKILIGFQKSVDSTLRILRGFRDLRLAKKISRHFLNQSEAVRKTTCSRVFSPLNASFIERLFAF